MDGFLRAALVVVRAAIAYGRRWREFLLAEAARTNDSTRKSELLELAEIFAQIRAVAPAANGEIYLTDAIRRLIENGREVRAVRLSEGEQRYDIGNHRAYFRTFVDFALKDPEWGDDLKEYLRERLARDDV